MTHTTGKFFALSVFLLQLYAPAQQISLGVHATAGLDDATRTLLEQYPQKMHDEVLSIINDCTPLLLKTADAFLDKFNRAVAKTLAEAQCRIVGTAKGVGEQNPLGIPFNKSPLPLDILKERATQSLSSLGADDNPEKYSDAYANLSFAAGTTSCQMGAAYLIPETLMRKETTTIGFRLCGIDWKLSVRIQMTA